MSERIRPDREPRLNNHTVRNWKPLTSCPELLPPISMLAPP